MAGGSTLTASRVASAATMANIAAAFASPSFFCIEVSSQFMNWVFRAVPSFA
jgi:hypothetical protein